MTEIGDIDVLFAKLNELATDKVFAHEALKLRGKIVSECLTFLDETQCLNKFEGYLRCKDVTELQKSKDYMLRWFFEKNIFSNNTNISSLLTQASKLSQVLLATIAFIEKSLLQRKQQQSFFSRHWHGIHILFDFSELTKNLQNFSQMVEDRKLIICKENFAEIFPQFFDLHKLARGNLYLKYLEKLCLSMSLKIC
jgi:hypothetical protein